MKQGVPCGLPAIILTNHREFSTLSYRTILLTLGLVTAASLPAAAQTVGTYTGTTADGQGVSFTVTQDSASGDYSITGENISFSAPCANSTVTLNTAWGTGYTVPITNHVAKLALQDSYFFFSGTLHFTGNTLSGTLASTSPNLNYNGNNKPTKALFCVSPAQAVSATLTTTSADMQAKAAGPKAVLFGSSSTRQAAH